MLTGEPEADRLLATIQAAGSRAISAISVREADLAM
jgi:uncharacterized protein with PIN domain